MLQELRSNIATGGGWAGLLAMGSVPAAALGRIELLCASVSACSRWAPPVLGSQS